MERKIASEIMLTLLLIGMLTFTSNIQPVKAEGTIYIRSDGSVDPPTAPISTVDRFTYTLIGNITSDLDGIVVERSNIIIDGNGYTVQGSASAPWSWFGWSHGIGLSSVNNVTIKGANIKGFDQGIRLEDSIGSNVVGNNITANGEGIFIYWVGSNDTISANNITRNNIGILCYGNELYTSITGNDVTANAFAGIYLGSSSYVSVSGNNVTANSYGVYLGGAQTHAAWESDYNSVSGNNIQNNVWSGIYMWGLGNTITGNDVTNNGAGVSISSGYLGYTSYGNRIYHNNFTDNRVQTIITNPARDWSPNNTNYWDDGYPSGGNYWSDYTVRYPDAHELDDSGIWDTPCVIDENNTDNYPLMKPWTPTPPTIMATVNLDPDTLNLRSEGKWITAYIQLPEVSDAGNINATTILLNGTISPVLDHNYGFVTNSSEYLVDHNNDGILERMVKFNRTEVSEFILSKGIMCGNVTLTLTGQFYDNTPFEGSDTIMVRMPGDANGDGIVNTQDLAWIGKTFGAKVGDPLYSIQADFNSDGIIDTYDLAIVGKNFGKTYQ